MANYNSLIDIKSILNEYSNDIQEGITEKAIQIAEQGKNELRSNSPRRTGAYSKGWRVDKRQGRGYVHTTIYNATNWQLTHLLEKPHLLRNGRKSTPKIHIAPVEEKCIAEFQRDVEQIIKNGG